MTSPGRVRVWNAAEGWGVLDSAATPGGCWAHFSAVLVPGCRELVVGTGVEFTFEAARQDGYAFRAVEVWPADQVPERRGDQVSEASPAYGSTLTLSFDDEDDTGGS